MLSHSKYQNYLLSLLLVSGGAKVLLTYYNFLIDITVFIVGLICLDVFYTALVVKTKYTMTKEESFYTFILLAFYSIAVFSLLYTPSFLLGVEKLFFMLIPFIGFFYVKIIKNLDLRVLYKTLCYVIIPIAIWFVVFKYFLWHNLAYIDFRTDAERFSPLRNSYLSFGYLLGVLSILSLKYSKNPLLIILFCSVIILGLGSRGALVFLILTLFMIYFKQWYLFIKNLKIKKKSLKYILFSLIPIACVLILYFEKVRVIFEYGLIRFTSLINASEDESLLGRFDQYNYAINEGLSLQGLTTGFGLGSFGVNYLNEYSLTYPHNIFLEAWYELGFLAMCLLALFFVLPFFHLKRKQILFALALFAFFNAMKTLSFSTDRNLFVLFGILIFHREIAQTCVNNLK